MTEHSEDTTVTRSALRKAMVGRRAALDDTTHAAWSARIVAHAQAALAPPAVVAFCWPIKHEPDVRALVADWRVRGTRVALPVVVAPGQPLKFRAWEANAALEPDRYGIPTPISGDWLEPALILLPLNGFDGAGFRLGYGGGFFDRTLAALEPKPLAVGIGFEINRLPSITPEPHDQPLDWIITEAGAFRPARA